MTEVKGFVHVMAFNGSGSQLAIGYGNQVCLLDMQTFGEYSSTGKQVTEPFFLQARGTKHELVMPRVDDITPLVRGIHYTTSEIIVCFFDARMGIV